MKLNYIQGLKGVSMLTVLFGHFYLIFNVLMSEGQINPPLNIFINGNLAVCLFLIMSGYLIGKSASKISSLSDLSQAIIKRYLRLGIPISFVVVIAYIFYLTGLYQLQKINELAPNIAIESFYVKIKPIHFLENLFFSPLGSSKVLGPCWMLIYIFVGSIIIYLLDIYHRGKSLVHIAASTLILIYATNSTCSIYFACVLIGYLSYILDKNFPNIKSDNRMTIVALPCIIIGYYIQTKTDVLNWNATQSATAATLFWLGVNYCKPMRCLLSIKPVVLLGDISFSIYIVHWPIICTLSCYLYQVLPINNMTTLLLTDLLISLFVVIIVSIFYNKYIEFKADNITKSIIKKMF